MQETAKQQIKRQREEWHREENIYCPYCGKEQSWDTLIQHRTFFGDGEDTQCDCEECGKEFEVEETVRRTFETRKKEKNAPR
ncbi:MAG: hypothetical protein KAX20_07015 [Candidatus Omnitrophica bacterium]|nr:hypothetical protein [Candidatus Omnitrophota bacterium]